MLKCCLFLLMFLASCQKNNSDRVSDYNFEDHYSISHTIEKAELKIKVSLQKGLHAYAKGEQIGRPIALDIAPDGGWQAIGNPTLPTGKKINLKGLGTSVVLEEFFEVIQKLKMGTDPGKAFFHMQVCTDTRCDRPRVHEINL